jgi:hypothetical protein
MKVKVTVETSGFSESSTKRWAYGGDYWEEDIEIEVPDDTNVDELNDDELLELAIEVPL